MAEEIWRDIQGYEGLYQVSDLGRVKRLPGFARSSKNGKQFVRGGVLKYKESRGYNSVGLNKDGKAEYKRVARLVAAAFIPNPENLEQVNHKDCNKRNDVVSNLEWCTAKYNCNYGDHNKKLSASAKKRFQDPEQYQMLLERVRRQVNDPVWKMRQREAQLNNSNSKSVVMMDMQGNILRLFPSIAEAFRHTGIHSQNIGRCCRGGINHAGGYKWAYE